MTLKVTFQHGFDSEWNEYVDLDDTEEIRHKDKLKAVITPLISCNMSEGSISSSHSGKVRVPQERVINIQPGFFLKQ